MDGHGPSVMSSLYTTVLPAYFDALPNLAPDEALDQALGLVNNLSRRKLLNNLKEMIRRLNELEPDENQRESETTFIDRLKEEMGRSTGKLQDIQGIYTSYSLSSSTDNLKIEPFIICAGENNGSILTGRKNAYGEIHWGNGIINQQNFYSLFSEHSESLLSLVTIYLQLPMLKNPRQIRGIYMGLDYNHNPVARRILLVKTGDQPDVEQFHQLFSGQKSKEELSEEESAYYEYTCQPGDYIKMCHVPSPQLNPTDLIKEKKMLSF